MARFANIGTASFLVASYLLAAAALLVIVPLAVAWRNRK